MTRVIASSSAEVWNGFATTSAAPARSASTAPATEPCAVSASVVTAGRQARAFMITAAPSPAGRPQVDDDEREVASCRGARWRRPRVVLAVGVESHRAGDPDDHGGDRGIAPDDEELFAHFLSRVIGPRRPSP